MGAMDARAQTWQRRLDDQLASGLSIAVWCRTNGCSRQSFYRWQARLGHGQDPGTAPWAAGLAPETSSSAFTEIHLLPPVEPLRPEPLCPEPLRLRLIGGRELLVPMSMPAASLVQLLVALESCAAGSGVWEPARPEFIEGVEGGRS